MIAPAIALLLIGPAFILAIVSLVWVGVDERRRRRRPPLRELSEWDVRRAGRPTGNVVSRPEGWR